MRITPRVCTSVLSFMLFLCNIPNVAQRAFEMVQKSRSRERGDIINYIDRSRNVHNIILIGASPTLTVYTAVQNLP